MASSSWSAVYVLNCTALTPKSDLLAEAARLKHRLMMSHDAQQSPLSAERRRRRRQFAAAFGGYTKHRAIEAPAVFRAHDAAEYVAATARVATLATVAKAARRFAAATETAAATATAEGAVVPRRLR